MKRTLLCIFLMFFGAVSLAATILLSLVRSERAGGSPVIALVFVSIVTIAAAAWYINREPDLPMPGQPEATARQKAFLWSVRALDILCMLVCFAFLVMLLLVTGYFTDWMHGDFLLAALAVAGIIVAALSIKEPLPIITRDVVKAAAALVMAVALVFAYLNYMPKFMKEDAINSLRSNEEFSQKDVFYPSTMFYGNGSFPRWGEDKYDEIFGANPFYDGLYSFYCQSYGYDANGLHVTKGYITFNPATGAYTYSHTEDNDRTYGPGPGEWPEFSYYFMYDKDGQHGAVLNLYFRDFYPIPEDEVTGGNPMLSVSSSEWDEKIGDALYPHNFSEDEALLFLKSIDREVLRAKLKKQISDIGAVVVFAKNDDNTLGLAIVGTEGKTVKVYFFGIEIATYQNGALILKI